MDSTFYSRVEKNLFRMSRSFGVRRYFRYRDDIIILGRHDQRKLVWNFVRRMFNEAGYFDMKVEDVSYGEAEFLDMSVQSSEGICYTKAKFKTASLSRPLGEDSLHSPFVHRTWPIAVIQNSLRACARLSDRLSVLHVFLERFRRYFASEHLLKTLTCASHVVEARPKADFRNTWWCVLPYHPFWSIAVGHAVHQFNSDVSQRGLFCNVRGIEPPNIRISWCNHLPSILEPTRPR